VLPASAATKDVELVPKGIVMSSDDIYAEIRTKQEKLIMEMIEKNDNTRGTRGELCFVA
jgi:hypothetical protein